LHTPSVPMLLRSAVLACMCLLAAASPLHDLINANKFAELETAPMDAIDERGPGGQTPLMMAVLSGKDEAVRILLKRGADTTVGEQDGYTPCHGAGFQGRSEIMKLLIQHGLQCTTDTHSDGFTPLHRACWGKEARHADTVRVLLKAGAPFDQPGGDGRKPIDMTSNPATKKLLAHRASKKGVETKVEL